MRLLLSIMVCGVVIRADARADGDGGAFASRMVNGGGGLEIFTVEAGNPDGPDILFIHGWAQSSDSWAAQMRGPLAARYHMVAMDLRGHGRSGAPDEPALYQNGALMARDVDAVIEAYDLDAPVLVGWSYGGVVIGDYLHRYGDGEISGVVTVGALVGLGTEKMNAVARGSGPSLFSALARLPFDRRLRGVLSRFWATPGYVRDAYLGRKADHSVTYAHLSKPLLVIQGAKDGIVSPDFAAHFASVQPKAEVVMFEESGHFPFAEEPARFDAVLADFMQRVD
ncbi:alpha/beta hydrolase [Acuticoccus sp. M5D2P5]|uniref:alpha/beta fold hydrolase n=1 Tax=Acuticoccus kalidii TaxID=2910977 RepID=UPI001F236868|nr:alpha/beta hydrolase [Acuticoccus kalidii]MCF3935098.1 alpha/beta hydrolase [Acuticoccus kalidii]